MIRVRVCQFTIKVPIAFSQQEGHKMVFRSWGMFLAGYILVRESALVFFDPGQYDKVKLNLVKNNAHLTSCELYALRRSSLANTRADQSCSCAEGTSGRGQGYFTVI